MMGETYPEFMLLTPVGEDTVVLCTERDTRQTWRLPSPLLRIQGMKYQKS